MENTQPQRIAYFDVLRILATFAVIVLHLSAQHWADTDVHTRAWQAFNLYDSAVRWAVPVFVMISGSLFLSGSQSIGHILKKNVLRIVTAFLFWSALYALFMVNFEDCPKELGIQQFLNGHYHMWFLFVIVALYLLVPLLRAVVRDEKLLRYSLLLALIFCFLLPQVTALLSLSAGEYLVSLKVTAGKACYPLAYFLLGYYLSSKEFPLTVKRAIYALGALCFVLTFALTSLVSRAEGKAMELFYSYHSINVLLVCAALFLFAREHLNFPNSNEKGHKCIRALSRWSFGAYLVHPLFIESFDIFLHFNTLSLNVFFSVPLLTLLIGALSFLVSALLHQIPFVKKYFV